MLRVYIKYRMLQRAFGLLLFLALATACTLPQRETTAEGTRLEITFSDWAIDLERDSIPAGPVLLSIHNNAARTHEFVMIRINSGEQIRGMNPTQEDSIDEDQFKKSQIFKEIEHLPPDSTVNHKVTLPTGDYLLFCNIIEQSAGKTLNHYGLGMKALLHVR